jgi:hypothetical protein
MLNNEAFNQARSEVSDRSTASEVNVAWPKPCLHCQREWERIGCLSMSRGQNLNEQCLLHPLKRQPPRKYNTPHHCGACRLACGHSVTKPSPQPTQS